MKIKHPIQIIIRQKGYTDKSISEMLSNKYGAGYSRPSLTQLFKSEPLSLSPSNKQKLNILTEYVNNLPQKLPEVDAVLTTPSVSNENKLYIYINKYFYLYFYDPKAINTHYLSRVLLHIGNNANEVIVKHMTTEQQRRTDYRGSVSLDRDRFLVFRLQTTNTGEKGLNMRVRIGLDKISGISMGGYMNLDENQDLVLGTLILEHIADSNALENSLLKFDSDSYKKVDDNIKKFFRKKEKNYIKLPATAVYNIEDLWEFHQKQIGKRKTGNNKVFIATPMSDWNPTDYNSWREVLLKTKYYLEKELNLVVYTAFEKSKAKIDFLPAQKAIKVNFKELGESDKFILIYLKRVTSSALIELGWALGQEKQCVILYKNKQHLPFSCRDLPLNRAKYIECKNLDSVYEVIRSEGKDLFKESTF